MTHFPHNNHHHQFHLPTYKYADNSTVSEILDKNKLNYLLMSWYTAPLTLT